METVTRLFKHAILKYQELKKHDLREKWYHKEKESFAFMKPGLTHYELFIVKEKNVFCFLLNYDETDFIHTAVRESSKVVRSSGPVSAELFLQPHALYQMSLKGLSGHTLSDKAYWESFFYKQ